MKRSSQVALLLMGVTGVGATGYMMSRPPTHCLPPGSPAAAAPAVPGAAALEQCPPRRSWTSSGYNYNSRSSWTRTNSGSGNSGFWPIFTRGNTSATTSTSVPLSNRSATSAGVPRTSTSTSTSTSRSGFGSTSSSYSRSSSSS